MGAGMAFVQQRQADRKRDSSRLDVGHTAGCITLRSGCASSGCSTFHQHKGAILRGLMQRSRCGEAWCPMGPCIASSSMVSTIRVELLWPTGGGAIGFFLLFSLGSGIRPWHLHGVKVSLKLAMGQRLASTAAAAAVVEKEAAMLISELGVAVCSGRFGLGCLCCWGCMVGAPRKWAQSTSKRMARAQTEAAMKRRIRRSVAGSGGHHSSELDV
jgi:hypothetical protein